MASDGRGMTLGLALGAALVAVPRHVFRAAGIR